MYDPLAGGGGEDNRAKRLGNRLCMRARLDSSAARIRKGDAHSPETARFLHICRRGMRPRRQISGIQPSPRLPSTDRAKFQISGARAAGVEGRKGGSHRIAYVLRRVGGHTAASMLAAAGAGSAFMQTAPAMRAIPHIEALDITYSGLSRTMPVRAGQNIQQARTVMVSRRRVFPRHAHSHRP